ncbi:hypothetical protein NM208_g10778 [Fusarium decemcellulare]|uniref:Uncharacterized protein n=1 Tax=Fusarium decemcellulare TaxID=57161 RepID=A0ACC1RWN6_9HYPO|nr:hypothetical protein NM208_g10778 [Fusarium decemcellulare]
MSRPNFDTSASAYKRIAQDVSRRIAATALRHIPVIQPGNHILDLACGACGVTSAIMNMAEHQSTSPPSITGVDIDQDMIQLYQAEAKSKGWRNVRSKVQDAQDLEGFLDEEFDLVFMNFGLMFVPHGEACVREIYRVLKPGGFALITTWKNPGVPMILGGAARAMGIDYPLPTSGGWDTKEKLLSTVEAGGFKFQNLQIVVEQTVYEGAEGNDIVAELSFYLQNRLKDKLPRDRHAALEDVVREQLSPVEMERATIDMIAWVCVAAKA